MPNGPQNPLTNKGSKNESFSADTSQLRAFADAYEASAPQWEEVRDKMQRVLDLFHQEASKNTRSGSPMPLTNPASEALTGVFSKAVTACDQFAESIKDDVKSIRQAAQQLDDNFEEASKKLDKIS